MPGVCQVCAAGRHRMPPSDVPHQTSTQLQWYHLLWNVCVFLWREINSLQL